MTTVLIILGAALFTAALATRSNGLNRLVLSGEGEVDDKTRSIVLAVLMGIALVVSLYVVFFMEDASEDAGKLAAGIVGGVVGVFTSHFGKS